MKQHWLKTVAARMFASARRRAAGHTASVASLHHGDDPRMLPTMDLSRLPIFYEAFDPQGASLFDQELDQIVTEHALQAKKLQGICNLAARPTTFTVSSQNLREDTIAAVSRTINRHRQVVCGLSMALFGKPYATLPEIGAHVNRQGLNVYTAEANSAMFTHIASNIQTGLLTCSEYFGDQYTSGALVNGVMHQDLQRTSFADESFDIILTAEVFEHIPDALTAEREIIRILRPGGIYCFTVPFLPYHAHDLIKADLDANRQIRYYGEPEYHGDPLRAEGILVFRLFSHTDMRRRFEALGCSYNTYRFWSKSLGILGDNCFVMVVKKPGP